MQFFNVSILHFTLTESNLPNLMAYLFIAAFSVLFSYLSYHPAAVFCIAGRDLRALPTVKASLTVFFCFLPPAEASCRSFGSSCRAGPAKVVPARGMTRQGGYNCSREPAVAAGRAGFQQEGPPGCGKPFHCCYCSSVAVGVSPVFDFFCPDQYWLI